MCAPEMEVTEHTSKREKENDLWYTEMRGMEEQTLLVGFL